MNGIKNGEIDIDANTKRAETRIKNIEASLKALSSSKATAEIRVNSEEARRKIAETKKRCLNLLKRELQPN